MTVSVVVLGEIQGSLHCGAEDAPPVEMTVLVGMRSAFCEPTLADDETVGEDGAPGSRAFDFGCGVRG